jgi:hypothetical protein
MVSGRATGDFPAILNVIPNNRDWYERKSAEKTFTLAGCVV